jgi:hypothetical protein
MAWPLSAAKIEKAEIIFNRIRQWQKGKTGTPTIHKPSVKKSSFCWFFYYILSIINPQETVVTSCKFDLDAPQIAGDVAHKACSQ